MDRRGLVVADAEDEPSLPVRCVLRAIIECALQTFVLLANRRIRQPAANLGRRISFADGSSACVYRETVIVRDPPHDPAVVVVSFRLRWLRSDRAHALFRLESELNTLLFAGFPGLVSKLWLSNDQSGAYRGLYQWDGVQSAIDYVRALSRVLALVCEKGTIRYAILPAMDRDEFVRAPAQLPAAAGAAWWCPVSTADAAA